MTKTIITIAILILSSSILLAQQEPVQAVTIKDSVILYTLPRINSEQVGILEKNIVVNILQSYQKWYKININGKTAWCQKVNIIIPVNEDLKIFHGKPPELIDNNHKNEDFEMGLPIANSPLKIKEFNKKQSSNKNEIREVQWGLNFGVNLTNYSSSTSSIFTSNINHYFAGIKLLYNINPYISFNSGLFYTIKGIEFDNNSEIIDFNIRYLEIPLSLKYSFSGIQNNSFYMSFGPYMDFYLSNSLDLSNEYLSKSLTTTDTGLHYGFGYQIAMNDNSKLFFEANYFLGTNSIFQNNIPEKIYNYNFNFSLGLIF